MSDCPNCVKTASREVSLYKVTYSDSGVTWICAATSEEEAQDWVAQELQVSTDTLSVVMVEKRQVPVLMLVVSRAALLLLLLAITYLVYILGKSANQGNPYSPWTIAFLGVGVGVWYRKMWRMV